MKYTLKITYSGAPFTSIPSNTLKSHLEDFMQFRSFFVDFPRSHFESCSSLPSVLVAVGSQITRSEQRLKLMKSLIRGIIQVFGYVPNSEQGALV